MRQEKTLLVPTTLSETELPLGSPRSNKYGSVYALWAPFPGNTDQEIQMSTLACLQEESRHRI